VTKKYISFTWTLFASSLPKRTLHIKAILDELGRKAMTCGDTPVFYVSVTCFVKYAAVVFVRAASTLVKAVAMFVEAAAILVNAVAMFVKAVTMFVKATVMLEIVTAKFVSALTIFVKAVDKFVRAVGVFASATAILAVVIRRLKPGTCTLAAVPRGVERTWCSVKVRKTQHEKRSANLPHAQLFSYRGAVS